MHAESNEGLRVCYSIDVADFLGDEVRKRIIFSDTNNGHEVHTTSYGVDFTDAVEGGKFVRHIVHFIPFSIEKNNRSDHDDRWSIDEINVRQKIYRRVDTPKRKPLAQQSGDGTK